MKKKFILLSITLGLVLVFTRCSEDKNESKDFLTGTWSIAEAHGTEWEEGVGVITPKAEDPDMLGKQLLIEGGSLAILQGGLPVGLWDIEYTSTTVTLTSVNPPLYIMEFTMKNKTKTSVEWEQREPEVHSDYSCNPTCLYYQKFWKLEFPN